MISAQRRRLERLEKNRPASDFGTRPGPAMEPETMRLMLRMLLESGALDVEPGVSALADRAHALLVTAQAQNDTEQEIADGLG